jgi:glutamine synthetase
MASEKGSNKIRRAIAEVQKSGAEMVDLKFCGFLGNWHHLTIPAGRLSEKTFLEGEAFDASAIPGFKTVEQGDMVLLPDPATLQLDPFWKTPTASFICEIAEADSKKAFNRDPRGVARRAEEWLRKSGVADESFWLPEFEFYIFDKVAVSNDINVASYIIDSEEADWNSGSTRRRTSATRSRARGATTRFRRSTTSTTCAPK